MKLRTENIQKSYKGRKVVKGVSIEVNQGEIVGLLGPNGAGKTTSFYMIVGLVSPNEGRVFLEDRDITKLAMYKRAEAGIGYLPQENSVFRKMSIEDNIMAVLELTKKSKSEREAKLEELISEFGLGHVRTNLGQSLSGGERRRTEIARALATEPDFVLLDEPFAGVDPIAVEDIQNIVSKLKEKNIGVLITDHNVQETLAITDRTYLLFEGNILKQGTAEELAADPMVRKVYLGENFELRKPSKKKTNSNQGQNLSIESKADLDDLKKLDNNKLTDIVKNYRQHGYSEEYRLLAIKILEDRGIDELQLKMSGNFDNHKYELAKQHFISFKKTSKIAFIIYLGMIAFNILIPQINMPEKSIVMILIFSQLVMFVSFYIALGKSYLEVSKYSKLSNKPPVVNGLMYLFFGGFLYIFAYFYFKMVMKEEMKSIK